MATTFGQQLRDLRKAKSLTQRQLAERVGVDFTYLSKLENDRKDFSPSEDVIRRLADVLGADAAELTLLARKIPSAIEESMTGSTQGKAFLRSAGDLTEQEWNSILELIKKKRKKTG